MIPHGGNFPDGFKMNNNKIHLGWIPPRKRTAAQIDAHVRAMAAMPKLAMPRSPFGDLPVGGKVLLTDTWDHPVVVKLLGQAFTGMRQASGCCFPAGVPVRMADGNEKNIEDVCVGDKVVSHQGRNRAVLDTMQRKFTGDMITVTPAGFAFPLTMTEDHQVAVASISGRVKARWPSDKLRYSVEWKRAGDLTNDDHVLIGWRRDANTVGMQLDLAEILGEKCVRLNELMKDHAFTTGNTPVVVNSNFGSARSLIRKSGINWRDRVKLFGTRSKCSLKQFVPVCPSLGRFIGLYLAEGGVHDGNVVFTFHRKETAYAAEVLALADGLFGAKGKISQQRTRPTVLRVRFCNTNLAAVLKNIAPGNVWSKRVPAIFFSADNETKRA